MSGGLCAYRTVSPNLRSLYSMYIPANPACECMEQTQGNTSKCEQRAFETSAAHLTTAVITDLASLLLTPRAHDACIHAGKAKRTLACVDAHLRVCMHMQMVHQTTSALAIGCAGAAHEEAARGALRVCQRGSGMICVARLVKAIIICVCRALGHSAVRDDETDCMFVSGGVRMWLER